MPSQMLAGKNDFKEENLKKILLYQIDKTDWNYFQSGMAN